MGEVVFHKGMDECSVKPGATQPGEPSTASGGPVVGYKGSDAGHSYGTRTGRQSTPDNNVIVSPTDK